MTDADIFISVGSNINPEASVLRALELLAGHVEVCAMSTFYRSPALERPDQPDYINGVVAIRTALTPHELKRDVLRKIEDELGRVRGEDKWAARTLDLDILLFGCTIIDEPDFSIPDPDIGTRPFLAFPLLELAPALRMPGTGEPLTAITAKLDESAMMVYEGLSAQLKGRILS